MAPRIAFVTCVELGLACLEALDGAGARPELVVTLADDVARDKSGRVPLDAFAGERGIPLLKVTNVNDDDSVAALRAAELDWLFIVGWSQIARPPVLTAARNGALGIHPTLLPVGRGRAPIPWAILKGLTETGVTLFQLDEGVDTGPVVAQQRIPIDERETATTLYGKVAGAHRVLAADAWHSMLAGTLTAVPQDESRATTWPARRPDDGEIHPNDMTVEEVDRLVRATTHPYPGAFLRRPDGTICRIWAGQPTSEGDPSQTIKCRDGFFRPGNPPSPDA